MRKEVILGLDASSTSTGWSIFNGQELMAYGVIKPEGKEWRERLTKQGAELNNIIEKYNPTMIVMEDVPLKSSGGLKVLVLLGAVQGYILGIAASHNLPVNYISPSTWRSELKFYDGTEQGKKREIMKQKAVNYVNQEFGLNLKYVSPNSKFNDDDIAESVCIGYSQVKKRKFGYK